MVAMSKGYFRSRGADITGILTSAGGGTSVRNMLASDLPFGEIALSAAVATIINRLLHAWEARMNARRGRA